MLVGYMYGIPNFWANPSIGNPMLCTITSNQPFEAILNHPKTGVSPKVNTNCGWFTIELISLIYCNICKLQRMLLVWARLQDRNGYRYNLILTMFGDPKWTDPESLPGVHDWEKLGWIRGLFSKLPWDPTMDSGEEQIFDELFLKQIGHKETNL